MSVRTSESYGSFVRVQGDRVRLALIAVFGFLTDRPEFLDISLVYALINFIGTVAVTKYVKYSHLGGPREERDWEDV